MGEPECDKATGVERLKWYKKSCANIFEALEPDLTEETIKALLGGLVRRSRDPDP